MFEAAVALSPFEWASQHLQTLGWPVLCFFAWRVSKYFEHVSAQAIKTINQIDIMATNHFPHMETSLQTQDGLLHSMDASLKQIATNQQRHRDF